VFSMWVQSTPHTTHGSPERVTVILLVCLTFFSSLLAVDAHADDSPHTNFLSDLHDQSLTVFEAAERLGKKVVGLAPLLQYGASLELAAFGLKPAKFWVGIRLPKNVSKLTTSYPGLKPDEFIRCRGLWVIPLGAGIDVPLRNRTAFTVAFALNVGGQNPFENLLPGLTFTFRF
jgi:hypothetical protein